MTKESSHEELPDPSQDGWISNPGVIGPVKGEKQAIYVGQKPLMAYVTSTLIQLANQPTITIKARGMNIERAVDVSQVILRRMENAGYTIGDIRIGSETVNSGDGRTRNLSTIEIDISKGSF